MHTYPHPRPALTVDVVIFTLRINKLQALLIQRAAELYKDALRLRVYPPPTPFPAVDTHLVWHERTHNSAAHQWFRGLLFECAS